MAGIVGFFGNRTPRTLTDISQRLAARGHQTASWHEGDLGIAVRGELPVIHSVGGLVVAVEGVTEISRLLADYQRHGAATLVRGGEPYAMVLADPRRRALVLARSGDGPGLYYSVTGDSVVAASEPSALIAGGASATPDRATIDRFVATGRCDDTEATFYAGIRRVLPGHVVTLTRRDDGGIEVEAQSVPEGGAATTLPVADVVAAAVRDRRVGIRLTGTSVDTTLLDIAIADPTLIPPVHGYAISLGSAGHRTESVSPREPGSSGDTSSTGATTEKRVAAASAARANRIAVTAVVADEVETTGGNRAAANPATANQPTADQSGVKRSVVNGAAGSRGSGKGAASTAGARQPARLRTAPVSLANLVADLPAFLADMGEPVPSVADYVRWCCARTGMGAVDTLLDPGGDSSAASRVADRIAARFGVDVRYTRQVSDSESGLTSAVLVEHREAIYRTFLGGRFARRSWCDADRAVRELTDFMADPDRRSTADALRLWRLFIVEQWLALVQDGAERPDPGSTQAAVASARTAPLSANPGKELTVEVDGKRWLRFPVAARRFDAGDPVPRRIAGYVREFVAVARADARYRAVFTQPWYVAVAESAIAAGQGRSFPVWQVRPTWRARMLARLVTRTPWRTGRRTVWATQLAIAEVGFARMLWAALGGWWGRLLRRPHWFDAVAGPRAAAVRGPSGHGTDPLSVTLGVTDPDQAADQIDEALALILPPDAAATYRGCVVLGDSLASDPVRGSSADRTDDFFAAVFADRPLDNPPPGTLTPLAVVVNGAAVRRPKRPKERKTVRRRPRQQARST